MRTAALFRSGNTLRVSVPREVRVALDLKPGMRLLWIATRPGVVEVRNADALVLDAIRAQAAA